MAMKKEDLGAAIQSAVIGVSPTSNITDSNAAQDFQNRMCIAVAGAVIDYLKANMELSGSSPIFSVDSKGGNVS